ncbi:MAG: thiamine phosphate synthase [Gordonia sp. (in: high G+C Gram-positive bacteria)]|uniref:thiamine phosphate synthase n=1 Tax=Gordonia sp. (in: high G+C Gram-positive bacteria) TaxID=84139 RepID=UPI0039E32BD9
MTLDLSLYLVTDSAQIAAAGNDPVDAVAAAAVDGGVTVVQVREKHAPARQVLEFVEALSACLPDRVGIIVNDRVDVFLAARERGARVTGVHVGQRDVPVETVRALVGPEAVIGVSAGTVDHLAAAARGSVDYVGIGPVHATTSKADAADPIGVDRAAQLAGTVPLPAVAIGGLGPNDVAPLRSGGLDGVAVVSYICGAPDPRAAAAELAAQWPERG